MLHRALSRGLAARAVVAAAVKQHQPTAGFTNLPACSMRNLCNSSGGSQLAARSFGTSAAAENLKASGVADADKEYFLKLGLPEETAELLARKGTYDNFPLDAEAVTAVESLPAQHREDFAAVFKPIENAVLQKAGELQRHRREGDEDAAGDTVEDTAGDTNGATAADRAGPRAGGRAAGRGADAADDPIKDVPSVAALMALGLPEDIADILANENIEYPLLVERIVAIENALLLAAADKARAEKNADAARRDADSARREAEAEQRERGRQAGLIDELKDKLSTMERRLKDALGHIVNRGILDREEDRMQYGRGNERQGREDAQRERTERWARWVEEHPDEAAALAEQTGWRPQDIPREVAALYEALRDYDNLDGLAETDPDRPVNAADIKKVMGDAAAPGSTAKENGTVSGGDDAAAADDLAAEARGDVTAGGGRAEDGTAAEGGGKNTEPKYPISDMKHT